MKRIQRRRTKGWQMPPNTAYVGRPSIYGNPFDVATFGASAAQLYRNAMIGVWDPSVLSWADHPIYHAAFAAWQDWRARFGTSHPLDVARTDLRGKDLACWCPPPCGAPVDLYGDPRGPVDPCSKPTGHEGAHDPSAQPCHADVLLELLSR